MLETIRSYALERLDTSDEAEDVRQAHAAHFLMLAEEAAPELVGPRQIAWLDRLDTDHDNLRLTLEHFASRDDASLLRLAAALWRFWRIRGYLTEGRQWLERALAARSDDTATRLVALTGAGELARAQADYARAQDWFENGLALAEQTGGAASADFLNNLGTVAIARGNLLEAKHRLEACLARLETIGDRRRMAIALNNLGAIDQYRGDRASATARYEECLAMCRSVGDDRGIAETLFNLLSLVAAVPEEGAHARRLGEEALAMCRVLGDRQGEALALAELAVVSETGGNLARACELYEESLSLFREIGDRGGVARNLGSLGMVALRMDDSARALALCGEGLRINAELGEREGVAAGLEEMAIVALSRGNHLHAVRWFAAADAIRTDIETPASPSRQTLLDDAMRTLKGEVDTVEFATTWGTGRTMGDDQAVREALSALPSAPFVTTAASGGLHPRPVAPTDLVR
jgi:tetratricopeptide (TPR) repeat protein